jgi:hypothetical protein
MPTTDEASVKKFAREARFVFTGQLEQEAASTLSIVAAGPATAVVRVERIHAAAQSLHNQAGQKVTVLLTGGTIRSAEPRWVFFANPVLYGETLGVREVARVAVPKDLDELHKRIAAITKEAQVEELRQHLAKADAIIHGTVKSVRSANDAGYIPQSEHDPLWMVATIHVVSALKGEGFLKARRKDGGGELETRFPSSRDVRWFGVPKPKAGDEGIFILHRDDLELGGATLAILHSDDIVAGGADEADRLAEHLK